MLLSSSSKRGAGAPYILLPSSHFPCHLRSKGNCLTSTPDFIKEKKEWGNIIQLQSYIYKRGRAIMVNYRERSKKSGTVINHVCSGHQLAMTSAHWDNVRRVTRMELNSVPVRPSSFTCFLAIFINHAINRESATTAEEKRKENNIRELLL